MSFTSIQDFYIQPQMQLLEEKLANLRKQHNIIVLATGVFDLLHQEHKNFLQKAKQAGDFLLVGVESDARVKMIKGKGRPIHAQQIRLTNIKNLPQVDDAFILPEHFSSPQDHEQLIAYIKPNILAISSHSDHQDKKRALVEKYGGTLQVVHEHNPNVSTTTLLTSLRER